MTAAGAWREDPLPSVRGRVGAAWQWRISRPAGLTAARRALRDLLAAQPLPDGADADDVDRLLLAFEELVSNGLRHGGGAVGVRVTRTDGGWLIDVRDGRPDRLPVPAVGRDPALGGLGLHMIARLSTRCGWAVVGAHKHVWACLTPAR